MDNTRTALIFSFFLILSSSRLPFSSSKQKIRSGIYEVKASRPVSLLHDINSSLFSHILCGYAQIGNSSMYEISLSPEEEIIFSNFSNIVKKRNPKIVTQMAIGGGRRSNFSVVSSMMGNITSRTSFIQSSIKIARLYGFDGLDFHFLPPGGGSDIITNLASLLYEWRQFITDEARISNKTRLILTLQVRPSPYSYSIDSIMKGVDWVHLLPSLSSKYFPNNANNTSAHAALYNPDPNAISTDQGINSWINRGLSANRLVIGLPYFGCAWKLVNKEMNGIGALANGSVKGQWITDSGWTSYKYVKDFVRSNEEQHIRVTKVYNSTYVMNYVAIGSTWIGYDDVEAVRAKVDYARDRGLLGYYAFQIDFDDDEWTLSRAADEESRKKKQHGGTNVLMITLSTLATIIVLFGFLGWFIKTRCHKSKEEVERFIDLSSSGIGLMNINNGNQTSNLKGFSFATIKAATKSFSIQNKLGQGGYGPVYKGILKSGDEIAVKRLSKSSTQGFEEFKNEVILTAKLQHVNLVKVLGFCIEKEEKMIIYEFMPNRSLNNYLYDLERRMLLNWEARVRIVEGIIQGLVYLQEYSRMTVIHRDIKASNILLDNQMKAKISDFGIARIFKDDESEARTSQVVGTYGYVPPEYVNQGIYSTKSDVYGFGVLLLQIISGKPNDCLYGVDGNLNLLEYAYELCREDRGNEFMDTTLDDTSSSYKLTKFLQVALLCVQESACDRPSVLEISSMLRSETADIKTPKKPAYSKRRDDKAKVHLENQETSLSMDAFTITEIAAR